MTPLAVPAPSPAPARAPMPLPAAPPQLPLAAPATQAPVEWAGAVRAPDAAQRAESPALPPARVVEPLTGPPPAFSANLLDQLPESLVPADVPPLAPPSEDPASADEPALPVPAADPAPERDTVPEGVTVPSVGDARPAPEARNDETSPGQETAPPVPHYAAMARSVAPRVDLFA